MSNPGGYTKGYTPTGIIHGGEYVVPLPYDYPKWWIRIRKFVWPKRLRVVINRKVRVYVPTKDYLKALTGKEFPHE